VRFNFYYIDFEDLSALEIWWLKIIFATKTPSLQVLLITNWHKINYIALKSFKLKGNFILLISNRTER
jgi:hypothetical protein